MKPNFEYLIKKLQDIVDEYLIPSDTGFIQIDTFKNIYFWTPSVNMIPDQYFFPIEEAYQKEYDSHPLPVNEIKENYQKLDRQLGDLIKELKPNLLQIIIFFLPKFFKQDEEISREKYSEYWKKGLWALTYSVINGTPFKDIKESHCLTDYVTLSEEEENDVSKLFNQRGSLLRKGLFLIQDESLTIYRYYHHFVKDKNSGMTSQKDTQIPGKSVTIINDQRVTINNNYQYRAKKENANPDDITGKKQTDRYGQHQKNKEWVFDLCQQLKNGAYPKDEELSDKSIKQEIDNVEGNGTSANRIAKQVQLLYKHKFGLFIDISTIKRYAGFVRE